MESKLKFKINDLITLKFENSKTNIYINGSFFNNCKYLLINIPTDKIDEYGSFNSIDDIEDYYSNSLEYSNIYKFEIDPLEEFWGHCSNLQAWVENDYDLDLLHSSLSFPLLKELSKLDPSIKQKFFLKTIQKYEENKEYSNERAIHFLLEYISFSSLKELCSTYKRLYTDLISYLWSGDNSLEKEQYIALCECLEIDIIANDYIYTSNSSLLDNRFRELKLYKMLKNLLNYKWTSVAIKNLYYTQINEIKANIVLETSILTFKGWIIASSREGDFNIKDFKGNIWYNNDRDSLIKISNFDRIFEFSSANCYSLMSLDNYYFKTHLEQFLKNACFSYVFQINRCPFSIKHKQEEIDF